MKPKVLFYEVQYDRATLGWIRFGCVGLSNSVTWHYGIAHLHVEDGRDGLHVLMVPANTCVE